MPNKLPAGFPLPSINGSAVPADADDDGKKAALPAAIAAMPSDGPTVPVVAGEPCKWCVRVHSFSCPPRNFVSQTAGGVLRTL